MAREADCIKSVTQLLNEQGFELTPGVQDLFKGYQEGCDTALERVNRAFETVEISI